MSEEQPSFRLVTDNSAFVRKPGAPPVEVAAREGAMAEVDVSAMKLNRGKENEPAENAASSLPSSTQRECHGCSKTWPENYLVRRSRKEKSKQVELWICPTCERNKAYEETGAEKVRVSGGGQLDTTKLFIIFGIVLVVISSALFWKFYNDTAKQKVDWITEDWASQPVEKWPTLLGRWEARVQGIAEPTVGVGFLLERRDGVVLSSGPVDPAWLLQSGVTATKVSGLAGKVQTTLQIAGNPAIKSGEFYRPADPIAVRLWSMKLATPPKLVSGSVVRIRRQPFASGLVGTLVTLVDGKQQAFPARIVQGVQDADEFILEMNTPVPAQAIPGALMIDEYGHALALGEKEVPSPRSKQRIMLRGALSLRAVDRSGDLEKAP